MDIGRGVAPDAACGPKWLVITEDNRLYYLPHVVRLRIVLSFRVIRCCCLATGAVPIAARWRGDPDGLSS